MQAMPEKLWSRQNTGIERVLWYVRGDPAGKSRSSYVGRTMY